MSKSTKRAREIVREVATYHGLGDTDVMGHNKARRFVRARFEAMWRIRDELGWSYPEIGSFFGYPDHAAAMNGVKRFEEMLDTEEGLAERLAPPVAA